MVARKGCQRSRGARNLWMFCLFGRWLLKRAISNECETRFPKKTRFKCAWQVCDDLQKLPNLQPSTWDRPPNVETSNPCPGNVSKKLDTCWTKIIQKLNTISRKLLSTDPLAPTPQGNRKMFHHVGRSFFMVGQTEVVCIVVGVFACVCVRFCLECAHMHLAMRVAVLKCFCLFVHKVCCAPAGKS